MLVAGLHPLFRSSRGVGRAVLLCLFVATALAAAEPLEAVFFFSPGCRHCVEAKAAVREVAAAHGGRLRVEWVDTSDPERGAQAVQRLFRMLDRRRIDATPSLAVFVGDSAVLGGERIVDELAAVVAHELATAGGTPERSDEDGPDAPGVRQSERFGLLVLALAALADGINPCAFAGIVFLVSLLAASDRSRREVLVTGIAYTIGVYLAYMAIGLFLYSLLRQLAGWLVVADLVFYLAFGLCVIAGALSLWDASLAWRGRRPEEMTLQLPTRLKRLLHARLRAGVRSRLLAVGACVAGMLVAVIESACTGQLYFPVLNDMVRSGNGMLWALGMLAWYCAAFVLPLVVVFVLVLTGTSSRSIAGWGQRNWGWTKLALAAVFVLMAVWMAGDLSWPPGAR
ncbi:MAG: hypothetical protein ACOCYN_02415 [Planctomycetota bacterium]